MQLIKAGNAINDASSRHFSLCPSNTTPESTLAGRLLTCLPPTCKALLLVWKLWVRRITSGAIHLSCHFRGSIYRSAVDWGPALQQCARHWR